MKAEELRKSILQMAIQGKLVPQDPNDEPASVLLERIRAEKQRLIKEGKIKKNKGDSIIFKGEDNCYYEKIGSEIVCIDDEIDFDLPEGWAFCRISSLLSIQTGAAFKKEQQTSNESLIRVLRGGNIIQGKYYFFDNDIFISPELVNLNILLQKNDIITPAVTSIENIGKMALIDKDYNNVTAGGFVFILRIFLPSDELSKYLLHALQSTYFCKLLKSITKKSGQAFYNLGKERLLKLIIPIPPIKEAYRIGEKIDRFLPYLEDYNKLEEESSALEQAIYSEIKKSILQYAIQGKLVPQDENEEPASVLLEKIRAEKKAKLGKKYVESYIYKGDDNCYYENIKGITTNISDELPFDIPDGWAWARLGYLIDFSKNNTVSAEHISPSSWILDLEDIEKDTGKVIVKKRMKDVKAKSDKHYFEKNDVLYSKLRPYLNKVIIADEDGYCTTEILVLKFGENIYHKFAQIYLMSPFFVNYAMGGAYGVKMPRIGSERGNKAFIPIPPLSEQYRIVQRVEQIIAKIEGVI